MVRKRKASTSTNRKKDTTRTILPKNNNEGKGSFPLKNNDRKKSNNDDENDSDNNNDNDGSIDNNLGTLNASCDSKEYEKNIINKNNNNINNNPLLIEQTKFLQKLSYMERYHFFSSNNHHISTEQRGTIWNEQADTGERLINLYSWATPDNRCIHILQKFQPIIEIGCGKNAYWYQQMIYNNINCIAYDIQPNIGGQIIHQSNNNSNNTKKQKRKKSTSNNNNTTTINVQKGGPEVLKESKYSNHTLFLCYPDEEQMEVDDNDDDDDDNKNKTKRVTSMANECINNYTGEYIIHVGELFMIGNIPLCIDNNQNNNIPNNGTDDDENDDNNQHELLSTIPWGRSSHYLFQIQLVSKFHCILKLQLNNWLHTTDTITVWKRTKTTSIIYRDDDDDENDNDNDDNSKNSNDEEVQFRYIPPNEQLPVDSIAPCLQEWYDTTIIGNNNSKQQLEQTQTNDDDNDNVHQTDSTAKIQSNKTQYNKTIRKMPSNNTNRNTVEEEGEEEEQQQDELLSKQQQEDNNNSSNNNNNKKPISKKSLKKRKSNNTTKQLATTNNNNDNNHYSCPW